MKTIVWDVDDVLNDLMRSWFVTAWLKASPACTLRYDQLCENPPHKVLNIPLAEYLRSIDAFREEQGARLEPNPTVLAWFERHGHRFRHVALTAVPLRAADTWAAWVVKHFGKWIRSFNFIPSHREGENLPRFDRTKTEFLAQGARVDAIVEDNAATVAAARTAGLCAVLVPQPWNDARGTLRDGLQILTDLG